MIEIWQCNTTGRYDHPGDQHDAPLDPNFHGDGRVFTDEQGRYRFLTIRPGAYPWPNHKNAWRPNHIHFSYFGPAFATRLVTQMYFPGDPLAGVRSDLQRRAGRGRAQPPDRSRSTRHHRAGLGAGLSFRCCATRARRYADGTLSMTGCATASQTIGPYWHLIEDKSWADLTRFGAGANVSC